MKDLEDIEQNFLFYLILRNFQKIFLWKEMHQKFVNFKVIFVHIVLFIYHKFDCWLIST